MTGKESPFPGRQGAFLPSTGAGIATGIPEYCNILDLNHCVENRKPRAHFNLPTLGINLFAVASDCCFRFTPSRKNEGQTPLSAGTDPMIRKHVVIALAVSILLSSAVCFGQVSTRGAYSKWRPGSSNRAEPMAFDDESGLDDQSAGLDDSANPGSPSNSELLNRLNQMQSEINSLRGGGSAGGGGGAAGQDITNPTRGIEPGHRRSTDVPRIEDLKATPTFPRVRLTGFFQNDAGWFSQDTVNTATFGNIQDVWGFRRTRLAAVGDVSETVGYMLEMDFSFPGRPSFMDVWADIRKVPVLGTVRVGQWRMPFGMDELTSVREITFLERFLGFAQAPFRQVGAGFHNHNEEQTITWDVAGYKFPTDFYGDSQGDRGYGVSGRITSLLYYDEEANRLIHVGADYSFISPAGKAIRFANQAEFGGPFIVPQPNASAPAGSPQALAGNLGSIPFIIDTGTVPVFNYQLFNAEAGAAVGSWYAQGEARFAVLNQISGHTSTLPTAYAETGYFLTGERRGYNKLAGVFGRVKPNRKWGEDGGVGAFETAFRYSYADFNGVGIAGNRLNDLTFGLNWYLNQYMKFQFNYIHAMVGGNVHGPSDFDTYCMRAQVDF